MVLKACNVLNFSDGNYAETFAVASPSGNITLEKPVNDPQTFYLIVQASDNHQQPSRSKIDSAYVNVTVKIQADCHVHPNSATFFPMSPLVFIIALLSQTLQ